MNDAPTKIPSKQLVTVVIPVLNEERNIDACLKSLAAGDYPADSLEVLVVDGGSTDASIQIAESWIESLPMLKVLHNAARIQSAALNLAIQEASGEYFVRLDAHSTYRPNHISLCVSLLRSGKADNVGGVQFPVGTTSIQKMIALTLRSPFAMGPSAHRHSKTPVYSESVYLGAWKTETLRNIGGFDQLLEVAEDYELNIRLKESGKRILVVPDLKCTYIVRSNLAALSKQYFRYGLWKVRLLGRYPKSSKPRHFAPGLLVLGLVTSAALLPVGWQFAVIAPLLYAAFLVMAVISLIWSEKHVLAAGAFVAFPVIHFSYGAGFLWGLLTNEPLRFRASHEK